MVFVRRHLFSLYVALVLAVTFVLAIFEAVDW